MKSSYALSLLLAFLLAGSTSVAAPQAGLNSYKSGLKATFGALAPTDFGRIENTNNGGPTLSGERAVFTGTRWVRYNTTAFEEQSTAVAMSASEDWVCSFEIDITAPGSTDKNLIETGAGSGGNIFRILKSNAGGADTWALLGGNGGGGYSQIGIFDLATGTNHQIAVHYKASNSRLDLYLNGVGIFLNFQGRSGNYDINLIHAGDDFPANGDFSMDNLFIGIKVEKPVESGVITSFPDLTGFPNLGIWRLTHDRAIRAEANYHNVQCWSHDGRYTVYTLFTQGPGVGEAQAEVHIVDLSTGQDVLVDTGYNPRWANHTNSLFYVHFTDDFWRVRRYDIATSNAVQIANGINFMGGGTDANDEWLFAFLQDYTPQEEWTPVRIRTTLQNPPLPNPIEFMPPMPGGSGVSAVNVSHPVLELRRRFGNPFLGSRATLYDLDGTNERIGILLSEEGHVCWSGGGEWLAVGNQQVAARRWDQPYPADLEILVNNDTQDISPMDRTDRYLTGAGLKVFDLRSGDGEHVVAPRSARIYPADGDNSTLHDIDPKGSPDGTKLHYHSVMELENLPFATTISYDAGSSVLHVQSTEGWPSSGDLVYRDKEVMSYTGKTLSSFTGIGRAAHYSQLQSFVENGAGVLPLSAYVLTPSEVARSHPDLGIQSLVAANGDPDPANNPLVYQAQTDCYVVVVRLPDAPHLRVTNLTVELIPGERAAEIRHYQLQRDGMPYPDAQTFFEPGDSFPINDPGTYKAVAIEWSILESPPGTEVVLNSPHTLQVLTAIPGTFSWTYEDPAGAVTNLRHRHDEGIPDRLIGRTFMDSGDFVREDLDRLGRLTRRQEYDSDPNAGGKLLRREYWRHDGPSWQTMWMISEENYDPGDGRKTVYVRYGSPSSGGNEVDRVEYNDGRPTKKFEGGSLVFDYTYLLDTDVAPESGGSVQRSPDQLGFAVGQVVTLTATPSNDYTFTGWSGDLAGNTNPDTVTMTGDKAVTANFVFNFDAMLDVVSVPASGGTVQRSPNQGGYAFNDVVTLTTVPGSGYGFVGWSNDLTGTLNPQDITMSGNKSVAAHFDLLNHLPTALDDSYTIVEDNGPVVLHVLANDSTAPDVGEIPVITHVSRAANVPGQPGVAAPMTDSLAPPRFGKRTRGKVSQWDLLTEPGRAVARNNTGNAERLTYKPTLDSDQTVTVPMPTNAPWAFEMMYKTSHAFGERNVFRLYAVGNPNDALYLSWVNNDLRLTDGATTSIVGTTSEYPPGFYYHILVHYKPATGLVDLYFDDVLVLGDRPLNGNADIDRFELRVNGDPGEPIDYFDEVRLGQAAQGTLTVVDDTAIVYEPPPGFFGVEAFTYTLSDGTAGVVDTATVVVTVEEDRDGDGMPDTWEQLHGLDHENPLGDDGANGDRDMDGVSNLKEHLAGTDANDAGRYFAITGIDVDSNGMVTVTWASEQDGTTPIRHYDVFRIEDLLGAGNQWNLFTQGIAPAGATTAIQDAGDETTQRVYRVGISGF